MKTLLLAAASALALSGAAQAMDASAPITAEDVAAAQTAWGEGIVAIGRTFTEGGDYREAARAHIEQFYAYEDADAVLFKPTLAAADQFRGDANEALSYFVGGDIAEDGGFAIAPYTAVRWENEGTVIGEELAVAMGNYFFTTTAGEEVKVEYSFAYTRDDAGDLKIVLHHSSLPYAPDDAS
ncbi:phosphoribosyl-AMP cyclohydrolase [Salinarimonas ramus]|uniref:Phosphoribosyl-AMP cyclohydrolase n=1 Tax=Salinarimonas ramus TaxID=690164 RepID=A0A917QAW0_9HYPH|nr:phosphoribosyl-AMP cyclohydrolase [Salinarimonas ramus]GGK40730.1 phosphoribosyl-AMP cyclohydrolase [Salinarimonas ramus]